MAENWKNAAYIKENPATYLAADAAFALECARLANARSTEEEAARFARMSILLHAISLEAFINFVYKYHEVPESTWSRLSIKDKWLRASRECLPRCGIVESTEGVVYRPGDPIETFREDTEPFASFLELKNFRDSLVHLDPPFAHITKDKIESHLAREEYYVTSRLPMRLQLCGVEHAQVANDIYQAMTKELDRQMKGLVLESFAQEGLVWMETITRSRRPSTQRVRRTNKG